MKIANLMTKEPVILKENATILEAVKKMEECDCGILPIVDDDKNIKGVITDRDIIVRAIAKNKDLNKTQITEIMSKNPIFCEEDDSLQQAVSQMTRHSIRRVLVKDKEGTFCGILSLIDVINRVKDKSSLADLFKEVNV
ncbi:CBS domain-containing protein [Allofrancisella guangzhouensis]|uniref:CBS domain-containing protein n=1 Tax=Allofrancisella guangzhouensis TaxID=594679 RepID=A0A0A8E4Z8_9GAMM|nr:CBS domain-containing protein [Allofrancisella guangzhouensis]AJC49029.1 hypothetical protein SD28_04965 [Allofrancisella guangzhouensis]MBK2027539.1 CBS domain-containing protein [Allofrancisella guangzhouensis]MBK2044864.1 CBS domain-containing protein [Allofrancisella guangzhouensis]MBK2046077.1 CBS domain-containing protein [Allofrancisella guangzhouensis]